CPSLVHLPFIQFAGIYDKTVLDRLRLSLVQLPIPIPRICRPQPQLAVDPPLIRKAAVFWVVKNGHVRPIFPSLYLHSNIRPHSCPPFVILIFITSSINDFSFNPCIPRHP